MNGHPTRPEDFDLYALGVLEGEEKAAIESHVPTCAECANKLAEARGRIALLAFSAPRVEPSPAVRERLMRQVHASAESAGARHAQGAGEPERAGGFFGRWWAAVLVPACIAFFCLGFPVAGKRAPHRRIGVKRAIGKAASPARRSPSHGGFVGSERHYHRRARRLSPACRRETCASGTTQKWVWPYAMGGWIRRRRTRAISYGSFPWRASPSAPAC